MLREGFDLASMSVEWRRIMKRASKRFLSMFLCMMLCIVFMNGCAQKEKVIYDVKKITCTFNLGDQDGARMYIFSADGLVTGYEIMPYSNSGVNLFAGEIPSEDKCNKKEYTISEDDWKSIVDAINSNEFMELPEEFPKENIMDGSYHYIEVETTQGVHRSGGYGAGTGKGKDHERFMAIWSLLSSYRK